MHWNRYKTKNKNKNTTYEYRYFSKSNFVNVERLFVLIDSNQDNNVKDLRLEGIIYQKVLSRIITSSSMKKPSMTKLLILI